MAGFRAGAFLAILGFGCSNTATLSPGTPKETAGDAGAILDGEALELLNGTATSESSVLQLWSLSNCGATRISKRHLITAKHCVTPGSYSVMARMKGGNWTGFYGEPKLHSKLDLAIVTLALRRYVGNDAPAELANAIQGVGVGRLSRLTAGKSLQVDLIGFSTDQDEFDFASGQFPCWSQKNIDLSRLGIRRKGRAVLRQLVKNPTAALGLSWETKPHRVRHSWEPVDPTVLDLALPSSGWNVKPGTYRTTSLDKVAAACKGDSGGPWIASDGGVVAVTSDSTVSGIGTPSVKVERGVTIQEDVVSYFSYGTAVDASWAKGILATPIIDVVATTANAGPGSAGVTRTTAKPNNVIFVRGYLIKGAEFSIGNRKIPKEAVVALKDPHASSLGLEQLKITIPKEFLNAGKGKVLPSFSGVLIADRKGRKGRSLLPVTVNRPEPPKKPEPPKDVCRDLMVPGKTLRIWDSTSEVRVDFEIASATACADSAGATCYTVKSIFLRNDKPQVIRSQGSGITFDFWAETGALVHSTMSGTCEMSGGVPQARGTWRDQNFYDNGTSDVDEGGWSARTL